MKKRWHFQKLFTLLLFTLLFARKGWKELLEFNWDGGGDSGLTEFCFVHYLSRLLLLFNTLDGLVKLTVMSIERAGTKGQIEIADYSIRERQKFCLLISYQIFKNTRLGKRTPLRLGTGIPPEGRGVK